MYIMCIKKKKVKFINCDCLHILMLLYIMLYIMLAYLMLFAALSNSVFLYNAFFVIDICKCLLFSCLVLVYRHSLLISSMIFHHAQCF